MAAALQLAATHLPPRLQSRIWQGNQLGGTGMRTVSSGHAALDALLPGAGWPSGSLTELLVEQGGIGEMRLVAPALRALTAQGRHVLLVAPPWRPYACALEAWGIALDRLVWIRAAEDEAPWAAEQALKQDGIGAVLLWQPKARADALRRLQVAAQDSQALAFLVRAPAARSQSSPAPLRMVCTPVPPPEADTRLNRREWMQHTGVCVDIFKRRGPPPAQPLVVTLPLQESVLPQPGAAPVMPWPGVNHAVDRRHLAVVAAGGRQAAASVARIV